MHVVLPPLLHDIYFTTFVSGQLFPHTYLLTFVLCTKVTMTVVFRYLFYDNCHHDTCYHTWASRWDRVRKQEVDPCNLVKNLRCGSKYIDVEVWIAFKDRHFSAREIDQLPYKSSNWSGWWLSSRMIIRLCFFIAFTIIYLNITKIRINYAPTQYE